MQTAGKKRFDVFLSYNSEDRTEVLVIREALASRGIRCWIDIEQNQPGKSWQSALEKQIRSIGSAAIFVGSNGNGPWQRVEITAFLREFVRRRCPVIPVLLKSTARQPRLPIFLSEFTWVDFRQNELEAIHLLEWGITGVRRSPPARSTHLSLGGNTRHGSNLRT
jgi:hypothetical protein